jgi:hypothetical protein
VLAALVANQPKLQYCYERQLLADPALAGSVDATLAIRTNGTAPDAAATGVDLQVSACMAEVLQHVEFPAPRSGIATLSIELKAVPAGAIPELED